MEYKELIPQADNLMESTRSIGYSLKSAIADIIDNSIAADAHNIKIQFPRANHKYLTILDDGMGMNKAMLEIAMVYGSKPVLQARDGKDLGRFGLGLKMASLSQCRSLTVVTKQDNLISCARWDLDFIKEQKKWMLQIPAPEDLLYIREIEDLHQLDSGTLVIWEKLDLLLQEANGDYESDVLKRILSDVESHLSLVFHRYLEFYERIEQNSVDTNHTPLNITCNGVKVEGIDPFLSEISYIAFPQEKIQNTNSEVSIIPWVLPYPDKIPHNMIKKIGDLHQNQGFYIYRNKRLVIYGSWFYLNNKSELSKLIRVQVDIPNSSQIDKEWKLDVKKSSATLPERLKKYLRKTVEKLSIRSKRTFTKRAKLEISCDGIWIRKETDTGLITYEINEQNEYVKKIIDSNSEIRTLLKIISLTLPYDSIYADRSDGNLVNKNQFEEIEFENLLVNLSSDLAEKIRGIYYGS